MARPLSTSKALRKKFPNTEFFLVRVFSHSDWIRRDTPYLSVSLRIQSECGKIRTGETPYLDTFHTVKGYLYPCSHQECYALMKHLTDNKKRYTFFGLTCHLFKQTHKTDTFTQLEVHNTVWYQKFFRSFLLFGGKFLNFHKFREPHVINIRWN